MNTHKVLQSIWLKKIPFIIVFFLIFTVSYAVLYYIDFLPEAPAEDSNSSVIQTEIPVVQTKSAQAVGIIDSVFEFESEVQTDESVATVSEPVAVEAIPAADVALPTAMYIKKLDKTIEILNPQSRTLADLDEALLDGAVRHPDSATLHQEGTMFILGHSSYLPRVNNKNFQAFNGIQNLEWGDTIEVTGAGKTYVYRVDRVYKAKASELTVPIATPGHKLTIATCNSFGSTDDRHIVEATLVETV